MRWLWAGLLFTLSPASPAACRGMYDRPARDRSEWLAHDVRVGNSTYSVLTCDGVNETLVPCGYAETAIRFEGALVCWNGSNSMSRVAEQVRRTPSICDRLPKGCKPYELPKSPEEPLRDYKEAFLAALRRESIVVEPNGDDPWLSVAGLQSSEMARAGSPALTTLGKALAAEKDTIWWSLWDGKCEAGMCPHLELWEMNRLTRSPDRLARAVAHTLRLSQAEASKSGLSVRVKLSMWPARRLRCSRGNPQCGPVPFSRGCLSESNYRPDVTRELVRETQGLCENDGDCSVDRNCDICESRFTVASTSDCPMFVWSQFADTYCGCVHGHCSWFRQ